MKQSLILMLALLCGTYVYAADYYVAPAGSDSNSGTSISAPFKTISAAAAIMTAGDTCYVRQGTYRETITPAHSGTAGDPITFMPYNSESVTVSGADLVTGWSQYSNSIYVAKMNWSLGEGYDQIFVDGAMVNRARWPNTGTNLLSPTTASGTAATNASTGTTVTFSVKRPENYWVGGTVYGLFGHKWASQAGTITSSTTNGVLTVTDTTNPWYEGSGSGYITGIFGELDQAGEWFLLGNNLYLWAPGNADPSTTTVEAKARNWCVNLSGKSYVNLRDLNMFAGTIRMDADNCEVTGCTVTYQSHFTKATWSGLDATGGKEDGNNGVWINGDNNVISNCTFQYSAGSGILVYGSGNLVTRSVISDVDYSGTYSCPLKIAGSTGGNEILFNTMHDTARDVIQFNNLNADVIMYNDLYNAGRMCSDLGILYFWGVDGIGTRIAYNWIHDNLASGPGLYNDNYDRNFIEDHNVIWFGQQNLWVNSSGSGSFPNV